MTKTIRLVLKQLYQQFRLNIRSKLDRIERQFDYYTKRKEWWAIEYLIASGDLPDSRIKAKAQARNPDDLEVFDVYEQSDIHWRIIDEQISLNLKKSLKRTFKRKQLNLYYKQTYRVVPTLTYDEIMEINNIIDEVDRAKFIDQLGL